MRRTWLLLPLISIGFLCPYLASAQTGASQPGIDQRCFTLKDCKALRKDFAVDKMSDADLASGFVTDDPQIAAACGGTKNAADEPVGFCLPAGQTQTTIQFGGQDKFANLGEFIKFAYRYLTWAAGLIAVAMIVVSGVQWAASGGSPDTIGDAKKRIGGAITGLILLALSYVILYTVNPYLVQLRLPQVWMINQMGLVPPLCIAVGESKKLQDAGEVGTPVSDADAKQKSQKTFDIESKNAACGHQYLVEKAGKQMCTGTACDPDHVCYAKATDLSKKEGCWGPDNIAGIISNSRLTDTLIAQADGWVIKLGADIVADFWAWPWVPDRSAKGQPIQINLICNASQDPIPVETEFTLADDRNTKEHTNGYSLGADDASVKRAISKCDGGVIGQGKGFVVRFDFNIPNSPQVEQHLIGHGPNGKGIDLMDIQTSAWNQYTEWKKIADKIPTSYFITEEQLRQGVRLDVDAGQVCTVYHDKQKRAECYGKFGYAL